MSKNSSLRTLASSQAARAFFVLASFSVLGLPTLAASVGSSAAQTTTAQDVQAQRNQAGQQKQRGQMGQGQRGMARMTTNLEVSYYTGDPLKGGKLISTVKLTPPNRQNNPQSAPAQQGQARQAANGPAAGVRINPVAAQAPKEAKFAVIRDQRGGARIIDLSRAGTNNGAVGRGGRGLGGPDGQNGPPKSPSR